MSIYLSSRTQSLSPYIPGEQPQDKRYIKLNTNENPYPPSPKVIQAINDALSSLRLYPDPESTTLRESIASYYGVKVEEVFVGNGSDEVLAIAFMSFFMPDRAVIYPDVTYTFYEVYAGLFGLKSMTVPVNRDFSLDLEPFCKNNSGVVIANPNAPTGIAIDIKDVELLLRTNPDNVVILDEAYIDFGGKSAVSLIDKYKNLLVVQTLSKSRSLAGLRVGFAIGSSELIEGLNRVKNSFNSYPVDRLAMAGAIAAIEDEDYFREITGKIINTRQRVKGQLKGLGFEMTESQANFLFITHPEIEARRLFVELKEMGILTRHFNRPRIDNYLRVTIGTDQEMDSFLKATEEILDKTKRLG